MCAVCAVCGISCVRPYELTCVPRTELARFLTFVRSVTEAIEKASGVPVPDYVKLRWESRSKGTPQSTSISPFSFPFSFLFSLHSSAGSRFLYVCCAWITSFGGEPISCDHISYLSFYVERAFDLTITRHACVCPCPPLLHNNTQTEIALLHAMAGGSAVGRQ